ncbi:conserved hypothetical protein (plasmid) [Borreliella afzelii ACA-1]|nr:conserved hypothetical protein [Borreliella afzelii ACA-1]
MRKISLLLFLFLLFNLNANSYIKDNIIKQTMLHTFHTFYLNFLFSSNAFSKPLFN